jgi:hypothetical protein
MKTSDGLRSTYETTSPIERRISPWPTEVEVLRLLRLRDLPRGLFHDERGGTMQLKQKSTLLVRQRVNPLPTGELAESENDPRIQYWLDFQGGEVHAWAPGQLTLSQDLQREGPYPRSNLGHMFVHWLRVIGFAYWKYRASANLGLYAVQYLRYPAVDS